MNQAPCLVNSLCEVKFFEAAYFSTHSGENTNRFHFVAL